jgi:hypothetical protein
MAAAERREPVRGHSIGGKQQSVAGLRHIGERRLVNKGGVVPQFIFQPLTLLFGMFVLQVQLHLTHLQLM